MCTLNLIKEAEHVRIPKFIIYIDECVLKFGDIILSYGEEIYY